MAKKISLADLQETARKMNGKCLSKSYRGVSEKYWWECKEGHRWQARANAVRNGHWCPRCAFRGLGRIEHLQKVAESRGGKCLSKRYRGSHEKYLWECAEGHRWRAVGCAVTLKTWCPYCAKRAKRSISELRAFAKSKGGRCLSRSYVGASAKYRWCCAEGHRWEASASGVLNAGSWCPRCARVARLDMSVLHAAAEANGGKCLSRKYRGITEKYQWRCAEGHTWWANAHNVRNGSWCPTCRRGVRGSIEDLRTLAAKQNGTCLSPQYLGSNEKHLWECHKLHRWEAKVSAIRRGTWCPECAKEKRRQSYRRTMMRKQLQKGEEDSGSSE